MFQYNAALLNVVDGDTLKLRVDLGFHVHVEETIRLARIDAPEMSTLPGQLARAFVQQQLNDAFALQVRTKRSEKYGRWLGEVDFQTAQSGQQWINLNDLLLQEKHAQPYSP